MEFEIDQKTPPETFEHFHNITKHNVMDDIVHLNVLYSVFFFFFFLFLQGKANKINKIKYGNTIPLDGGSEVVPLSVIEKSIEVHYLFLSA